MTVRPYSTDFWPPAPMVWCQVTGPLRRGRVLSFPVEAMVDTGCDYALVVGRQFPRFKVPAYRCKVRGRRAYRLDGLSITVEGRPLRFRHLVTRCARCPEITVPLVGRPILREFVIRLDGPSSELLIE